MNAKDIEPTPFVELPASSQAKMRAASASQMTENPLFGMWKDRDDASDVESFARKLRSPRFAMDGSRSEKT